MANQLKKLAIECSKTDYSNKKSVNIHNANVKKIRSSIESTKEAELLHLLDDELCKGWIVFQLAEYFDSNSEEMKKKIVIVLSEIAEAGGINAFAAKAQLEKLNS